MWPDNRRINQLATFRKFMEHGAQFAKVVLPKTADCFFRRLMGCGGHSFRRR